MNLQHGDVLIKGIGSIPKGAKEVARKSGKLIVMEGEATGHHHCILDKEATLLELDGEFYLEVTAPVTITHEEHKPIEIPTGIYQVGQVREYDYLRNMQRKVID